MGKVVGNKMHKAFPLPGESSHWQYKFPLPVKVVPTARRLEIPLPGVCTAIEEMMKKLPASSPDNHFILENLSAEGASCLGEDLKVVATARRLEMPLPEVCTAMEEKKKKLPVK
nr:hypothetical protein [Tanacetum cinerariifolium]